MKDKNYKKFISYEQIQEIIYFSNIAYGKIEDVDLLFINKWIMIYNSVKVFLYNNRNLTKRYKVNLR